MQNDNYVIDEKRGMAWGSPSEALDWYQCRLSALEAFLVQLKAADVTFYYSAIELGNGGPDGIELEEQLLRLMP